MSGREHGHDPLLPHGAQAVAVPPRIHAKLSDELEVVPGFEHENLQGWIPQLATEADIRAVIEKAFDYRGDVTITRKINEMVKITTAPRSPDIFSTAASARRSRVPWFA